MAETIIMPKLGFNMSEGKLIKWYKSEGENVQKGEALFSIETDKSIIDIEATCDGVIRKLLIDEGDKVPVTLPIAIIGMEGEIIDTWLADAYSRLGKTQHQTESVSAMNTTTPIVDGGSIKSTTKTSTASSKDFEIIIIGGGPGGYVAAIKAAQLGKRTAIIEKHNLGGVCINWGCIPTKVLLRSVEALREVKESYKFGVINTDVSNVQLDLSLVQKRKNSIVSQLSGGISGLLNKNGVTVINGEAILKDKNTVVVGEKSYSTEYVIIATGSSVKSLPVPMDSRMDILTSTEVLDLNKVPDSIVIIGGGVIGIELAYFLASIGSKVTVLEFLDGILPMVDEDITIQVAAMLQEMGVTILTSAKVTNVTKDAVLFEKSGKQESVSASKVLMAVGRCADFGGIDCQRLGIKTDHNGISVDLSLKTSVDNIYAIGDVNGKWMLAHTASMEAEVAVDNICGHDSTMDYDKIPSAIYIQPEIACVGLTEVQAIEKYGSVKVGKFPLFANGKAKVAGEENGLIKVIVEPKYNEIVGVHLFCIHATDMIAEAVVAMKLEGTAEEITKSIHPHPTVSEIYHEAFHAALGKAIHI